MTAAALTLFRWADGSASITGWGLLFVAWVAALVSTRRRK